jgi:hypothetical protein
MAVWLCNTFFGRLVLTTVVWVIGALIVTDETVNRTTRSGKISVRTVVQRLFVGASFPIWGLFLLFGFPWLNLPGEIKSEWNQPIQTTWGYVIDIVCCFCAWYAGILVAFGGLGIVSTAAIDFMFRNDPEHRAWRRAGGQSYIDNLPAFLNDDPDEVRNANPPSAPPTTCCPNCQGELTLANGFQCGNCGLFWNGYQWLVPPQA